MLDEAGRASAPELPLDFTQFLSQRLRLEPPATLAVLGSFLLTFEPSGNYSSRAHPGSFSPPPHPDHNT
jgi:hypothetical protein